MRHERTGVTHVVTRLNVGGVSRQIRLLAEGLPLRGFDLLLVSGLEAEREGRLSIGGPNAVVVPELAREMRPLAELRALRSITRLLERGRPEIVHTHMAKAGTLGRLAARRTGVPVLVHTFHGHVLRHYFRPAVSRAFLEVERRLARRTDALVAASTQVRDELLEMGIGTAGRWRVIPYGIDLADFGKPDRASARAALRLPLDARLVGIVGRMVAIKDVETFIRAAARIARSDPTTAFVVAGDGELRPSLERSARAALGERVRFLGWVHDIPTLYAALDVVALTSRNEGTPVSLIEAAAACRPVVATRVGGVSDVVQDGRTGWLIDVGDDVALASRVGRLLEEPATADAFGRAGHAFVTEHFSTARMLDAHASLYGELVEKAGHRRAR